MMEDENAQRFSLQVLHTTDYLPCYQLPGSGTNSLVDAPKLSKEGTGGGRKE